MNDLAINVERVVREVLAELGVAAPSSNPRASEPAIVSSNGSTATKAAAPAETALSQPHETKGCNGDLVLDQRVVTMNDVLGRLNAVRRVTVVRDAIVTPAVRDELLRRGIALGHSDACGGRPVASARLIILTIGTKFDSAALAAGLARENLKVERAASDCVIAAVDQLAAETARPDTLGVLLTPHTSAALCLANRLPGVRAVTGRDAPTAATAAAAVGANVLAIDPEMGTFFQLKQIITEFCRCGVRACPEVLCARLK